ncbi:MAG: hypothetical protein U0271_38135 [Polyangiaceae bacterium]
MALDPVVHALERFCEGGIEPDLALVRPRALDGDDLALFTAKLEARGWRPLPTCIHGWNQVSPADATVLLASCRYRSLAYSTARGVPADHLAAARDLVTALGATTARLGSGLYKVVSPMDLSLPKGGYGFGCSAGVSAATFEESVWLVGPTHVALLVWTDED